MFLNSKLQITRVYGGEPFSLESMVEYLDTYGEILKPYIGDTSAYLRKAAHEGKKILTKPNSAFCATLISASILTHPQALPLRHTLPSAPVRRTFP